MEIEIKERRKYTQEEINIMIGLYLKGYNHEYIAGQTGSCKSSVRTILLKNGYRYDNTNVCNGCNTIFEDNSTFMYLSKGKMVHSRLCKACRYDVKKAYVQRKPKVKKPIENQLRSDVTCYNCAKMHTTNYGVCGVDPTKLSNNLALTCKKFIPYGE